MHLRHAVSLVSLFLITACGQKGPLFLPDEAPAEAPPLEDVADEDVSEDG